MTSTIADRVLGAFIGASTSGVCVGLSVATDADLLTLIALFGMPAGGFTGFVMAPRVLRATSPWGLAVESAVVASAAVAIVLGIAFIAAYVLTPSARTPTEPWRFVEVIGGVIFAIAFSFGIGLPLALPVSLTSTLLLRWMAPFCRRVLRRPWHHDQAEPVVRP